VTRLRWPCSCCAPCMAGVMRRQRFRLLWGRTGDGKRVDGAWIIQFAKEGINDRLRRGQLLP